MNYTGVRNLFQLKQDTLIAEAQSQITFIHPSESCLISIHSSPPIQMSHKWCKNNITSRTGLVDIHFSGYALFCFIFPIVFVCLHHTATIYDGNERICAMDHLSCLGMIIMTGLDPGTVVIPHAIIGHRVLPLPLSTNCHQFFFFLYLVPSLFDVTLVFWLLCWTIKLCEKFHDLPAAFSFVFP